MPTPEPTPTVALEVGRWTSFGLGGGDDFVIALAIDPSDPSRLYAGTSSSQAPLSPGGLGRAEPVGRLWRSVDGGRKWEMLRASAPPGVVLDVVVDSAPPYPVYAVVSGQILRSGDRGSSWDLVGTLAQSGQFGHLAVQPGGRVLVVASGKLLRSADGGATWEDVALDPIGEPNFKHCEFSDVAVDPYDAQRMYAVSVAGVVVSEDAGASWQGPAACFVGVLPPLQPATFVLPDPTTPGRVHAAGSSILVSEDAGRTFGELATDLPAPSDPSALGHDGERIYVALSGLGVFRSRDGARWQPWNEGLVGTSVHDFALMPGPGPVLAAATGGRGVALRLVGEADEES